jgi:hypothetical protein
MAVKPPRNFQGKAIVDWDAQERAYYMMLPDGEVFVSGKRKAVEKRAKQWAKENQDEDAFNVLFLEWRDCPKCK